MRIEPMSAYVGANISDVNLAEIDAAGVSAIKAAVAQHGMVAIRDQHDLTPAAHVALAKAWGGIDLNNYFPINGDYPEIAEVRKTEEQKVNIGGGWHTDHSYDQVPAMGSILVARELPPTGGDTLFASMAAAYDALSDGLKATLATMRAVHSADHIYSADGIYAQTDQAGDLRGHDLKTLAVHPVVIRHPQTGQQLLYVNPGFTRHFEGWTMEESAPLLQYLYSVAMREAFHCRLVWEAGTVAIWDNRSTWHYAMNDYHGHRRIMHRITLTGEEIGA